MAYKVATGPTLEPFTVAYIKTWLKIPSSVTVEDTLLEDIIKGARTWAEQGTGRALLTQTIEEYWDCWPECGILNLSVAPIQSITSVSTLISGTYTVWASSNYNTDTVKEPCRIVPKPSAGQPNYDTGTPNAIKVIYLAGATAATGIPKTTMDAMLQRIAFLYENREDIPISNNSQPRLRSADALLLKNRML